MGQGLKQIGRIIVVAAICIMLNSCGKPKPTSTNDELIDVEKGCVLGDVGAGEVIPADDGDLAGVVPMAEFECSGLVYKVEEDSQDGFSHNVTLVFGKLASPEVFRHVLDDGTMNKKFDDDFVLDIRYFKSHVVALFVRSDSDNLEMAVDALQVGDAVSLKGSFVYLETERGLVKTSLMLEEFRAKYIYLTEMATVDSIYN